MAEKFYIELLEAVEPEFEKGDILHIDPSANISPGDWVLNVRSKGTGVFKQTGETRARGCFKITERSRKV